MTLYTLIESRLGRILLTSSGTKLSGLYFADQPHARISSDWTKADDAEIFLQADGQLEEYASGKRETFELPLDLKGTPFQVSVWNAIHAIPYGQTITYAELAERSGRSPRDARAVGAATGRNPLSWILPCHRVVGKSGALTGYTGGLSRKNALLEFEAARASARKVILAHAQSFSERSLAHAA